MKNDWVTFILQKNTYKKGPALGAIKTQDNLYHITIWIEQKVFKSTEPDSFEVSYSITRCNVTKITTGHFAIRVGEIKAIALPGKGSHSLVFNFTTQFTNNNTFGVLYQ